MSKPKQWYSTRYNPMIGGKYDNIPSMGEEKSTGRWVLFEEAEREVERLRAMLKDSPVSNVDPELLACIADVFVWQRTGILPSDSALRKRAMTLRSKFGDVFDAGEALSHAEKDVAREAMKIVQGAALKGSPVSSLRAPEGWALVPIEATEAMVKAGGKWSGLPSQTWADMLDTAPSLGGPALSTIYSQEEFDEAYEIGKREGYEQAVQEIDMQTGGDGVYRACLGGADPDRHMPDPATMIQRIVGRFEVLNLLDDATKTGRDQPEGE